MRFFGVLDEVPVARPTLTSFGKGPISLALNGLRLLFDRKNSDLGAEELQQLVQIFGRIDRQAVHFDFVMKMRASTGTGVSNKRYHFSTLHPLPCLNVDP